MTDDQRESEIKAMIKATLRKAASDLEGHRVVLFGSRPVATTGHVPTLIWAWMAILRCHRKRSSELRCCWMICLRSIKSIGSISNEYPPSFAAVR